MTTEEIEYDGSWEHFFRVRDSFALFGIKVEPWTDAADEFLDTLKMQPPIVARYRAKTGDWLSIKPGAKVYLR
jgi:hypothetical protein